LIFKYGLLFAYSGIDRLPGYEKSIAVSMHLV